MKRVITAGCDLSVLLDDLRRGELDYETRLCHRDGWIYLQKYPDDPYPQFVGYDYDSRKCGKYTARQLEFWTSVNRGMTFKLAEFMDGINIIDLEGMLEANPDLISGRA